MQACGALHNFIVDTNEDMEGDQHYDEEMGDENLIGEMEQLELDDASSILEFGNDAILNGHQRFEHIFEIFQRVHGLE